MKYSTLFRKASTTYFFSSLFFSKSVRADVNILYAFVRTADDFVDQIPQDKEGFVAFRNRVLTKLSSATNYVQSSNRSVDEIIDDFVSVANTYAFDHEWIRAFLDAMESDLHWDDRQKIKTYVDLQKYMYGSAGVIGLMMCRILHIPKEAYRLAKMQGEAMQLINFIRDVSEDHELGRNYIPMDILNRWGCTIEYFSPDAGQTEYEIQKVKDTIKYLIEQFMHIQKDAYEGYRYIPYRYRVAIKTAADMYMWTAKKIYDEPSIVLKKKVKPSKLRVIVTGVGNTITELFPS